MIEYVLVLAPVCIVALAASCLSVSAQRQLASVLVLLLTAFSGLRGYVGTDTAAYHGMFKDFGDASLEDIVLVTEPLFAAWLKLSALLTDNSFVFVASIAVLQGALLFAVLMRHEQPTLFLAVYAATFYLNLHFNVLRSGVSALFLLLAFSALRAGRPLGFQSFGIASILTHYSSVLFYLPLNLVGRRPTVGLSWLLVGIAVAGAVLLAFVSDSRIVQYMAYIALFDSADSVDYGLGLAALFGLVTTIYALTVSRSNFGLLTLLFVFWCALRLASNHLLFVSRLEVVANLLFLLLLVGLPARAGWQGARTLAIALLVVLNLYGTISGLEATDRSTRDGFGFDPGRRNSTYLPYRFAWEE